MHEFETFVYLDVQKTGSTFVSYVLTENANEKIVAYKKHDRVGSRYDPSKFYFITVRDPVDQYISLYSHGCGGMGGLARRLRKRGHGDLYDSTWQGFRAWLKFVLEPETAPLLDDDYGSDENAGMRALIGFQTYRYLELAMREPIETLRECKSKDDVRAAYKEKNIVNYTIRHESFDKDFETLLTGPLARAMRDPAQAAKMVRENEKLNISDRVDRFVDNPKVGRKSREALKEREWFMNEVFGY